MPINFPNTNRRQFLKLSLISFFSLMTGFFSYRKFSTSQKIAGKIKGANFKAGHLLRTGVKLPPSTEEIKIETVIVGGGMAGLSAAWWLKKQNVSNFILLELDTEVGGNSTHGSNEIGQYPWGAHYVPIPGENAHYVKMFFEEIGVIEGYQNQLPIYNEYYLGSDPHERLYFQGAWQEGLIPQHGVSQVDKNEYEEFFKLIEYFKNVKGNDGKLPFSIPMELSSQDKDFVALDTISMAEFLTSKNWNSKYLHWFVNYCCRDDYGAPYTRVSAWAGLHYFASRNGQGFNAQSSSVLTWPEGNGFLVNQLKDKIAPFIKINSLVYSIEENNEKIYIDVLDTVKNSNVRYVADHVIYAAPRFTAKKVIKNFLETNPFIPEYAPWLVANISLKSHPHSNGAPLAWDNVSYYSKSLGYIVANHQDLKFNHQDLVITYYLPLDEKSPLTERVAAYQRSYQNWVEIVSTDLEKMHPGISNLITNLDIWIWGHGMVSPGINQLWSEDRKSMLTSLGKIEFAHTDMSGISIFEEAQFRGVEAARKIIQKISKKKYA